MTIDDLYFEVRTRVGDQSPGREAIRRYEVSDVDEERANLFGLIAIAQIFNVPLGEISVVAAEQYRRLAPLWQGRDVLAVTERTGLGGGDRESALPTKVRFSRLPGVDADPRLTTLSGRRKPLTESVTEATLGHGTGNNGVKVPYQLDRGGDTEKAVWPQCQ